MFSALRVLAGLSISCRFACDEWKGAIRWKEMPLLAWLEHFNEVHTHRDLRFSPPVVEGRGGELLNSFSVF